MIHPKNQKQVNKRLKLRQQLVDTYCLNIGRSIFDWLEKENPPKEILVRVGADVLLSVKIHIFKVPGEKARVKCKEERRKNSGAA